MCLQFTGLPPNPYIIFNSQHCFSYLNIRRDFYPFDIEPIRFHTTDFNTWQKANDKSPAKGKDITLGVTLWFMQILYGNNKLNIKITHHQRAPMNNKVLVLHHFEELRLSQPIKEQVLNVIHCHRSHSWGLISKILRLCSFQWSNATLTLTVHNATLTLILISNTMQL